MMKYTLIGLILMGGAAMAQSGGASSFPQNGFGGGGASHPSHNMNNEQASDNDIRLVLQFAADQGGQFQSYPSTLSGAVLVALRSGFLDDGMVERIVSGNLTSGGSGGVTTFKLTDKGHKKLAELTASTPNSTRMVHGQKFIPGVGIITYGAPYEAPLSGKIELQDGTVIDKR